MGKTRDLFKKIRDTKGIFHAKIDSIKDRNGMDLREAEDTKMWQEYTEELYKKDLKDPDNHDGVVCTSLVHIHLSLSESWAFHFVKAQARISIFFPTCCMFCCVQGRMF